MFWILGVRQTQLVTIPNTYRRTLEGRTDESKKGKEEGRGKEGSKEGREDRRKYVCMQLCVLLFNKARDCGPVRLV